MSDPIRRERFRAIYDDLYDDIDAYCRRRTTSVDDAHDAVAEVFTIVWRRLEVVPAPPGTRPWVFGVARNQLRNDRRKRRTRDRVTARLIDEAAAEHAAVASTTHGSDDESGVVDQTALTLRALGSLREADQEVLRLLVWDGLSHTEIAAVLDCSSNAVAIRVHRARKRLARQLDRLTPSADDVKGPRHVRQVSDDGPATPKEVTP
ncbi:MAG: sigma-70 family RNA polymerase sigma factor [Actinomycetota bacterium]